MLQLDGRNYNIQSPKDIATDMVNYINTYCSTNNVRNRKNEVIFIDMNWSNPLFVVIYGVAYILSLVQKVMYNVACGFSIPDASDRQLVNLAQIANIQRRPAKKTTIRCTVLNNNAYTLSLGRETPSTTCTVQVNGEDIIFRPAWDVTIPAGNSALVVLISDNGGSYPVAANDVLEFYNDTVLINNIVITHDASINGTEEESIISMRERMQARKTQTSRIDSLIEGLENLEGVNKAKFFFNYSPSIPAEVHGMDIPPRMGLLIIQGASDRIADTFYSYMSCETFDTSGDFPDRSVAMSFTTKAGQVIPLYYLMPVQEDVYIKVYVKSALNTDDETALKMTCASAAQNLSINDSLTSSDVIELIHEKNPNILFDGVELSKDGITYSYVVNTSDLDGLLVTNYANVSVEVSA